MLFLFLSFNILSVQSFAILKADFVLTSNNVSKEDFLSLAEGNLDPMMAFMSGKLKVAGDMSVAMGLQSIFSNM